MGDSIRTIIEARGDGRDGRGMKPGDVYVLNAPYRGGTHLPDITVIMPVFVDERRRARLVRRRARPSCRYRRDRAGIDAAGQPDGRTRKAC